MFWQGFFFNPPPSDRPHSSWKRFNVKPLKPAFETWTPKLAWIFVTESHLLLWCQNMKSTPLSALLPTKPSAVTSLITSKKSNPDEVKQSPFSNLPSKVLENFFFLFNYPPNDVQFRNNSYRPSHNTEAARLGAVNDPRHTVDADNAAARLCASCGYYGVIDRLEERVARCDCLLARRWSYLSAWAVILHVNYD